MKVMNQPKVNSTFNPFKEIDLMKQIDHPHVI